MCTFHFINNHKWCQLFVFHSIGYWSAELWCIFLIAHPPHTKKANEDAETLDVQREYKTIKHRHRFFVHGKLEDCCYHIMIDQQKPMIIRVGSEDHNFTRLQVLFSLSQNWGFGCDHEIEKTTHLLMGTKFLS